MKVVVFNTKGGGGKTTFSTQISLYFDTSLFDLDPYGGGVLEELHGSDRVLTLGLNDELPHVEEGDVVYDFGGFDDKRIADACEGADIAIIPFKPTIVNMKAALESYSILSRYDVPIMFIVNEVVNDKDAEEAIEYLEEAIGESIDYFVVPHSRAVQTAENGTVSIVELSESSAFKKHTYKKIAGVITELMNKIKTYVE